MRTYIKKSDKQIIITVTFEGAQWQDMQKRVSEEKDPQTGMPFEGQKLIQEASHRLLDAQFQEIMMQVKEPVVDVNVAISRYTNDFIELILTCDLEPEVTLTSYKGLNVDRPEVAPVTGDDLDSKLKETQQAFAYFETKDFDGVVEMGDTVIIDYQGLKDGVAFEGGTAQGHNLEIGSHSFIPGFEEGLLGMKIEESKDLPLTFPENYHAEELAGADVIFKVTIQGIKAKKLPDIDDDLALDTSIKGVENLEDLKAHLEREIIRERTELAEEDFTTRIMDQLIALNPVELPEGMIQTQIQTMVQQYMTQLQQQGVSLSQVLKYNGMDHKAFLDSVREPAINNLKSGLILRAIIKAENLIATEEEIDEALTEMAQAYNMTLEQFKTAASSNLENIKANLSQQAAYNKAIQFVKDHTVSSN